MRCKHCGTNNPETNNFCGQCGHRLATEAVPESLHLRPARVRSTGDALSALGIDDLDYVDVTEHHLPDGKSLEGPAEPSGPLPFHFAQPEPVPKPEPSHFSGPIVAEAPRQTTISGPSFLGLADTSESDQSDYLLQDDPPRRRGGWALFFLIAIAVFAGIGWLEWNSIKTGKINIPFLKSSTAEPQQTASVPTPTQDSPDKTAAPAPAPPPVESSDEKLTTSDSAANDAKVNETKIADEKAAAESAQSRLAQEANQQQAAAAPSADSSKDTTGKSQPLPSAKAKPSPRSAAVEPPPPDPRLNKMVVLGENYLYGRGVPQNCNQALVYFRSAAEENNAPAMSHLGAMYASGNCVTQSRTIAYSWFAKAQNTDPNNHWLERNLNMLWRDMTPKERAAINR